MKKKLSLCAAALIAIAMTGCEKTGTVEGVVLDAFTNKPVEMPTVWMDSTIFGTHAPKYKNRDILKEGKFKFDKVPVREQEYTIRARRSKYIMGVQKFTTTEAEPNKNITLFVYSDQVPAGLYFGTEKGPDKVKNEWVLYAANCTESVAGYRLAIPEVGEADKIPQKKSKKGKKKAKAAVKTVPLPAPHVMDSKLKVLYKNESSVTAPMIATVYPTVEGKVSAHKDCNGFDSDEKGIFADKANGKPLTVSYKAENLYEVTGDLLKGKQIVQFTQEGKVLQTYYFEVK